jgi:hypothetical protein
MVPSQSTSIPDNEDSKAKAGRIGHCGEDNASDASMAKPKDVITDTETDTENENRKEVVQKAVAKPAASIN